MGMWFLWYLFLQSDLFPHSTCNSYSYALKFESNNVEVRKGLKKIKNKVKFSTYGSEKTKK